MDKVALLGRKQREGLFRETATHKNMTPAIAEKDFWVTWTLHRLFAHSKLSQILIFKGGTSLSKAYGLIERFSEDIDLILDWTILTDENPNANRSKNKQEKLNKDINKKATQFIANELLEMVKKSIGDICEASIDDDPYVISVRYPASFTSEYIRPKIKLEIGPLAEWMPNEKHTITPYSAEIFPDIFETLQCEIPTIAAERTFWEKATILHHEANRPKDSLQPPRYSRHYYDLSMMSQSKIKENALNHLDLLNSVVEFKKRFYPRGWAMYDAAKPGTFKLIPPKHIETSIKDDYKAMKNMIYGRYIEFDEMMQNIKRLEDEINDLAKYTQKIIKC